MFGNHHDVKRLIPIEARRQRGRVQLERNIFLSASEQPESAVLHHSRNHPTTILHLGARQIIAASIGQKHGNRHLNVFRNVMTKPSTVEAKPSQNQSKIEPVSSGGVSIWAGVFAGDPNWDSIIQRKLEEFLTRFSNIPISVPVKAADMPTTTIVFVKPPYFLNEQRTQRSIQRLARAKSNRKAATGSEMQAPIPTSSKALTGKSTPEEIQRVLQEAVNTGKLVASDQQQHLESEDLRNWLIQYGIGIDCSGFVSQAINEVMLEIYERAAVSTDGLRKLNRGSGQLKGGRKDFLRIKESFELRPGDTMHTKGHIRIITQVESDGRAVIFTTAESRSGLTDVGPDTAFWRFPNAHNMDVLQRKDGDRWRTVKKSITFGRYEKLEKFRQDYAPLP